MFFDRFLMSAKAFRKFPLYLGTHFTSTVLSSSMRPISYNKEITLTDRHEFFYRMCSSSSFRQVWTKREGSQTAVWGKKTDFVRNTFLFIIQFDVGWH